MPSFRFNVTVWYISPPLAHLAYSVSSPVTGLPKPYGRVPAASVVQPTNTLPSRVGSAGFVTVCPYSTVAEVTDVPSFELKVTVYVFGVHLAYSVRSPVTEVALKS